MPDKQAGEAEAGNDTDSQAESEASSAERKAGKGRSSQVRQPTPWAISGKDTVSHLTRGTLTYTPGISTSG